eukprot:g12786.t1
MPGGRSAAPTAVTLVYYHVPTDQDEQQFPNAFPLPKSALEIRLRDIRDKLVLPPGPTIDIREKFPLPGSYHFRFKLKWSDSQTVWMDVTNEDSVVPSYDDKIICKGGVDLLGFDSTGNSPKNSKTTDLLFDGFTSAPPPKKDDFDLF